MPTPVELTERQLKALCAVKDNQPCTAHPVAEAIEPGSDVRGAAQTLRRMPEHVVRDITDGQYRLTNAGKAKVRRYRLSLETSA